MSKVLVKMGSHEPTAKSTVTRNLRTGTAALTVVCLFVGCSSSDGDSGTARGQEGVVEEGGPCGIALANVAPLMDQGRLNVLAQAEAHPGERFVVRAEVRMSGGIWDSDGVSLTEEESEHREEQQKQESEEALVDVLCEIGRMGATVYGTMPLYPAVVFGVDSANAAKIATEWPDTIGVDLDGYRPPQSGSCTPVDAMYGCTLSESDTFCYGLVGRVFEWNPDLGCGKETFSSSDNNLSGFNGMAYECIDTGIPWGYGYPISVNLAVGCYERVVEGGVIDIIVTSHSLLQNEVELIAQRGWSECMDDRGLDLIAGSSICSE